MISIIKGLLFTGMFMLFSCSSFGQLMNAEKPFQYQDIPVRIEIPVKPIAVEGSDGYLYMNYYIVITNLAVLPLTINRMDIKDHTGRLLLVFEKKDLEDYNKFRSILGVISPTQVPRRINPATSMVALVWLRINNHEPLPDSLFHDFAFEPDSSLELKRNVDRDNKGREMVLADFPLVVQQEKPVVIGLPFKDGIWKCGSGPGEYNSPHQTFTNRAGNLLSPQRYAFDFSKVDSAGNVLPSPFPNEITSSMFYGYGHEVLAVADGKIVFMQDSIPENIPQAKGEIKHATELNRKTYPGNWICLEIKKDVYAFYAHLQPGRIKVKVGDHVKKGQVIAYLGNSGNAAGPHLHFQVSDRFDMDGGDLNGNEGLPFVFDEFSSVKDHNVHRKQIPLNGEIIGR